MSSAVSSIMDAETLLAVDVGSVHTRASLFDLVDGRYRLVATGRALSTAAAPLFDIGEGIRQALEQVRAVTGRTLVDESETLILPSDSDGSGVDVFVATSSAGPTLRVVLVGLMPGVSLESARRLAASSYLEVVGEIGLADRRREEEHIDLILATRPDLILVVGGTDGGSSESVLQLVETVGSAAGLMADGSRPVVVYAGNRELGEAVVERLGDRALVTLTPNIRPSLAVEDLGPARLRLAEVIAEFRSQRISGYDELSQWSRGFMLTTADAFGRMVRHLSQTYDPAKGVLGIDLGASQTTIAAAFEGDLRLSVRTDLGLGVALPGLLKHAPLEAISRWLPIDVPEETLRDYIYNKSLHPATVPVEKDELHIELALARQLIVTALALARDGWPVGGGAGRMPPMEPIIASGGVLSRTPRPGSAALALLDAVQPTGVTTLVLDPYNLLPALGAAAGAMPMVSVHVLESGSFASLATVVAPVGDGRPGRPVLRVRLEGEGGGEAVEGEVRYGQLATLPLRQGESGRLTLRPERDFDVGFGGPGRAGAVHVTGGVVGLVIDARGRPLQLPKDPGRRRDANQKWLWDMGGVA